MQEITPLLVLKAAFGGLCRETPFHGNEMTKPPARGGGDCLCGLAACRVSVLCVKALVLARRKPQPAETGPV